MLASAEEITAYSTLATGAILLVTAILGLIQLRHAARASEVEMLAQLVERFDDPTNGSRSWRC